MDLFESFRQTMATHRTSQERLPLKSTMPTILHLMLGPCWLALPRFI